MKRLIVSLVVALMLVLIPAQAVFAAITQDVTITATPTFIALTNSEAAWTVGTVVGSSTYWWTADTLVPADPFVDGDMKSTITNTGSVAEDIDIKVAAFSGGAGWTISLDDTPVEGEISLSAGATGTLDEASMVQVITTDTELINAWASLGTKMWCMEMETPASFVDGDEKTGVVTLTATAD